MRLFRSFSVGCFATSLALIAAACSGQGSPASPFAPPSSNMALSMACSATSILAGQIVVCRAATGLFNIGLAPGAVWTSSDPNVARSEGAGLFIGRSTGQVTLTMSHTGVSVSGPLTVELQDMVDVGAAAYQGIFRAGTPATVWLQGGYGVASADSGTLTLVVTDHTGATIQTSTPLVLPRGGDHYITSTSFTVPSNTTRICRKAVLQVGSTTVTAVPAPGLVPCFDVSP